MSAEVIVAFVAGLGAAGGDSPDCSDLVSAGDQVALIAAAPDLLEALKDLASESKETFAHWPDLKAQVEAAIAKAEGRS